jgi:DNA-binding protein HU-beta
MVTGAVQKGEEVSRFGFGTFKVSERAARKGRNPRTGEVMKIAIPTAVKLNPATILKAKLNQQRCTQKSS